MNITWLLVSSLVTWNKLGLDSSVDPGTVCLDQSQTPLQNIIISQILVCFKSPKTWNYTVSGGEKAAHHLQIPKLQFFRLFFLKMHPGVVPRWTFMSFERHVGCGFVGLQTVSGFAASSTWLWISETTGVCVTSPRATLAAETPQKPSGLRCGRSNS